MGGVSRPLRVRAVPILQGILLYLLLKTAAVGIRHLLIVHVRECDAGAHVHALCVWK